MRKTIFLFMCMLISYISFAQKPKKIFSSLQEGNIIEAQLEYDKFSSENKYNHEEIILFKLANSLLMIAPSSKSYNPIESIVNFNNIFISTDEKEDIIKFLEKYELDLSKISQRIHSEIVVQAKKLNSIESYSNAIGLCLPRYKEELQTLLERKTLDIAKYNLSVNDLNIFIFNYSNSIYNTEAIDFRDSIALSKVPNNYEAMLAFSKEYPNSKFSKDIISNLSNLLFEESIDLNTVQSLRKFISIYPNDSRVNIVKQKLSAIKYTEISINKKY